MRFMTSRHLVFSLMAATALFAGGCDIFGGASEDILATSTPTPTATSTPTSAPKAAATAASATSTPTAQPARLRGVLGVDHPPFARDYGVGGNSVGLACLSGAPANGILVITLGGGTGAPATITGPAGPDGTAIIPFPIQQFGPMNGSVTSLQVGGQASPFQADPFTYTVGSADLICTPPR